MISRLDEDKRKGKEYWSLPMNWFKSKLNVYSRVRQRCRTKLFVISLERVGKMYHFSTTFFYFYKIVQYSLYNGSSYFFFSQIQKALLFEHLKTEKKKNWKSPTLPIVLYIRWQIQSVKMWIFFFWGGKGTQHACYNEQ